MPGNILSADTGFPSMETGSTEEKLNAVKGYLYQLLEQLRYTLNNLGAENFNGTELENLRKTFTEPVELAVKDAEKNLAQLKIASEEISTRVESVEGDVSQVSQKADSITGTVTGVTETVNGLSTQMSAVKQTIDGLSVTTGGGTTYISGSSIQSGTIEGSELKTVMREEGSETKVEGRLSMYYHGLNGIIEGDFLVGGVWLDKQGEGTSSSASHRMFVGTIPNNGSSRDFPLKLQSGGDSSYEANGDMFLQVPSGKRIILEIGGTQWIFTGSKLTAGGKTIATV